MTLYHNAEKHTISITNMESVSIRGVEGPNGSKTCVFILCTFMQFVAHVVLLATNDEHFQIKKAGR